jgi:hypothetical protein
MPGDILLPEGIQAKVVLLSFILLSVILLNRKFLVYDVISLKLCIFVRMLLAKVPVALHDWLLGIMTRKMSISVGAPWQVLGSCDICAK